MKLSDAEWKRFDEIKKEVKGFDYRFKELTDLLDKLRPSDGKFTFQWAECQSCGWNDLGEIICKDCGGLGKVKVKVKSTAHN